MKTIKNNFYWSLGSAVLPMFAALISLPVLRNNLTSNELGTLIIIWTITGYFSIFDLGIGRSLTIRVSEIYQSDNDEDYKRNQYIYAGSLSSLLLGLLGAVLLLVVSAHIGDALGGADKEYAKNITHALIIISISIPLISLTGTLRGGLEGLNQFRDSSVNKMIGGVGAFGVPALISANDNAGIEIIASTLVVLRVLLAIHACYRIKKYITKIDLVTFLNRSRRLMSNGVWITISGFIGPIMVYGDRFIVSSILGAEDVNLYYIPQELITKLTVFSASLSSALLPHFASINQKEILDNKGRLFGVNTLVNVLLFGVSAAACQPFMALWMGEDFAKRVEIVSIIFIAGTFVNSLSLVNYTKLHASNKTKSTAIIHFMELLAYIPAAYVATKHYGLEGAATIWSARCLVDYLLINIACRHYKIK